MSKRHFTARVSFLVSVEADTLEDVDTRVNELIDELGGVETVLAWDDVSYDVVYASAPTPAATITEGSN